MFSLDKLKTKDFSWTHTGRPQGKLMLMKSAESEKFRWSLPRTAYLEQKLLEFPQHVNRNLGELLEAECAPA